MTQVDLIDLGERVGRPDDDVRRVTREHLARLTLPADGLGRLGDLAVWLAGVQGREVPRDEGHVGAFRGQEVGDREADAAAPARDDRPLAVQLKVHAGKSAAPPSRLWPPPATS